MKILSKVLHVLILLSSFTPYFPIGCKKHAVETEKNDITQTDTLHDSIALDDALSKINNTNVSIDTLVADTVSEDNDLPFYAPIIFRESGITGFGVLTGDMENDLVTIFSLRLCWFLAFIALIFTFFKRKNIYKKIFTIGLIELACLLVVLIFNHKGLLYGFYVTLAFCLMNTILSRYIWKQEDE